MTRIPFSKSQASVLLDLLRGVAAVIVVLEHWRNFFFVDYPQIVAHRALLALPYLLCSAGHQAVVIFFVLSGYLVSGSVFRMMKRNAWSWTTYLTHRLTRLWIVLLPGLLLCLLWDTLGIRSGLAAAMYNGANANHMVENVTRVLGPATFFGNLFFLQGLRVHTFGSDGALWSLANEFWYYILFPLGLLALHPRTGLWQRTLSAALFGVTAWFVRGGILLEFPIWLAGTLLCVVPAPRFGNRARALAAVLYVPLLFFFAKQRLIAFSGFESDYLLGLATFAFLWVLLSATEEAKPSTEVRFSRTLARFSYTLYVVHMPFLVLLAALTVGDGRWTHNLPHVVEAASILLLALAYAYGVASLTEFRTDSIRRWIERKLRLGVSENQREVSLG